MSDATLIQCTATKREHQAQARLLYDESTYFRKMKAWAKSRGDPWFILSAKYGLVSPYETLEPYDKKGLSLEQGETIAESLADKNINRVYVCAGNAYLGVLTPALEAYGIDVIDPFAGLMIGERLSKLDELA